MSIFGAVLGKLAGGLAGKLFGGGKQESVTNFTALRNHALAAGFNPLTALKATGGAGFTTTSGSLSSNQFLAEAIADSATTWFNRDQIARDEEMDRLKTEMMREELKDMQRRSKLPVGSFGYSIPHVVTTTKAQVAEPPALGRVPSTGILPVTERDVNNSVSPWKVDSRWDPAEKVEQEYAEVGSFPYAAAKLVNDLGWNIGTRIGANRLKKSIEEAYRKKNQPKRQADWSKAMSRRGNMSKVQ